MKLTPNPAYRGADEPEKKSADFTLPTPRFICPITMKEMNGKQRFCYMRPCGCVMSEQAIKELALADKKCLQCNQQFNDFILLNPKGEELENLRSLLEKTRKVPKKRKLIEVVAVATTNESQEVILADGTLDAIPDKPAGAISTALPKIISAKQSSAAIQSIYQSSNSSSATPSSAKGNWLTKGTFTRYVA